MVLTNQDRAVHGLTGVTEDALLDAAAQYAAEDMAANGYFSHVSPDGKDPWYWLNQVGYRYSYAGENLAVNFTDSEDVQTAWMESPTHKANIMKREYTHVGFGTANGIYEGKETTFVVEFLAAPPTSFESGLRPKASELRYLLLRPLLKCSAVRRWHQRRSLRAPPQHSRIGLPACSLRHSIRLYYFHHSFRRHRYGIHDCRTFPCQGPTSPSTHRRYASTHAHRDVYALKHRARRLCATHACHLHRCGYRHGGPELESAGLV